MFAQHPGNRGRTEGGRAGGRGGQRKTRGGERSTLQQSHPVFLSLSFSNCTGNINTCIISIFVSHLSDPAKSSAQGPVTQCQQVISLLSHRPGKPEPLGGKKKKIKLKGRTGKKRSTPSQTEATNQIGANRSILTAIKRALPALQGHKLFSDF